MYELFIYGCSDDLIEIDGDYREEFYSPLTGRAFVIFSDGTIIQSVYDGDWTFEISNQGSLYRNGCKHFMPYNTCNDYCCEERKISGVPEYSEVACIQLSQKPEWVAVSNSFKRIK